MTTPVGSHQITGKMNTTSQVSGLNNDTFYKVKVSAINSSGIGTVSETAIVAPRNAPLEVVGFSGVSRNVSVELDWDVTGTNGGGKIVEYKIEKADNSPNYDNWQTVDGNTTITTNFHTVSDLTNGISYKFRVSAKNTFLIYGPVSTDNPIITPMYFEGSGGNKQHTYTSNNITYKTHTFTSSGSLNITGSRDIDFLIVAGGGAGARGLAGGGGGGGVVSGIGYTFTAGTYIITVGTGGPQHNSTNVHAVDGGDSEIEGITGITFKAPGGGAGGGYNHSDTKLGNPGGSGGGHSGYGHGGGAGGDQFPALAKYYDSSGNLTNLTGPYGYVTIVSGVNAYGYPGGGGGRDHYPTGAGGAGGAGTGYTHTGDGIGHGGDGVKIDWVTPEALGVIGGAHGVADTTAFYWAGGGGGAQHSNNANDEGSGDGGRGGGGAGAYKNGTRGEARPGGYAAPPAGNGTNAYADYDGGAAGENTGGGGGGGEWRDGKGGEGGDGIVVIRYIDG
ncbi:MAG: hypothetical protein CMM25_03410 [Rhodospirillaceae bacterium]|nr:hypothetical protein [Rhodospirillaceae bacterium]